jgi:RNase P/RNase MRP subunit POP5
MRIKNRYIIAQIIFPNSTSFDARLTFREIQSNLREKIEEFYGQIGFGTIANSTMVKFFEGNICNFLIIRCLRENETSVRLCLSSITSLKVVDNVCIRTLRVHGSSRTCLTSISELYKAYLSQSSLTADEQEQTLLNLQNTISSIDM